ncbi:L-threonylcarbamoyladenylate synthase [soil metagenome]
MPQVSLTQMVEALTAPTLISFPTDTVPALASRPEHADLIYAAKRRSLDKPLVLMGASLSDLLPYVAGDAAAHEIWKDLTDRCWPGQLTLVLPASDRTPPTLNPQNTGTLGIRVPSHPIALDLLARTGPLATTSANLSGQSPLTAVADIARTFPTALTLPTEAFEPSPAQQTTASGTPSTVAQWTGSGWQILRQGEVRL